ncbi:efflux RND transporter periplasmic adaptor subunit [Jiulongibacter sediminis]|uniref:efflux RND transporter periplasmic adaptor subunit n=1 Tax=Jiulongibacter sediminis TaxID=1605367 RepID=UPI0026E9F794|nr:efflux RND transporter periplasmic adaptor subunit [Jiulongibacter sediminis]
MKKYAFLLIALVTVASSCGEKQDNSLESKKAELAKLKGEVTDLESKIDELEAFIEEAEPDTSAKITYVKAMPIVATDLSHYVEANGRLEAVNNVFVSPQMGGALTKVYVTEGDYVKKGQTIATIDNSILRNSMNEIKIQMETAKTLFERQKALWDQKIGTEVQYIQAKAQVESLEKRLATLEAQDAQNIVKSPIDGYVDEVRMKAGEMASPGLGIVRVVNLSNLKVVARIPDTYAGTIQKGDVIEVTFPDLQKTITARLSFVSQTVDPVTRTFVAEAKVPFDRQLKPNLNASVKIKDQNRADIIAIPRNLIQRTEKGDIVYVAENRNGEQVAGSRVVTTGLTSGEDIEILTGLQTSDILITEGYQDLVDGELISY